MRALLVGVMAFAATGCFHHQAHLPGVFDMRTDGSGLAVPAARKVDPKLSRTGGEAIVQGAGLSVAGADVVVEERHFWLMGSIPIYNQSATPELHGALAVAGMLTAVEVTDELSFPDAVAAVAVPMILPPSTWIFPSYTFTLRARAAAPLYPGAPSTTEGDRPEGPR